MDPLVIPQQLHFNFDPALDMHVREGFRAFGKVFAGVHWTSWQRDNIIWGFRRGIWQGGPFGRGFVRACPENLRLEGASEETDGIDHLARIAPGDLHVRCEISYQSDGNPIVDTEFRLYSAADESFVTIHGTSAVFPNVAAGSYILWARCFDNFAKGDPLLNAGEWSALKVRVGAGAFSIAPGISPNPGCALYSKDGDTNEVITINAPGMNEHRVPFDPLARSVSASCQTEFDIRLNIGSIDVPAGSQIIGGLRASRSGPQSALWQLNSSLSARLLAVTETFSTGKCECGKSDHHASDVGQAPDGTLYLLSECSLHAYEPDKPTITERLPGSPAGNGGHPGGQTLRFVSGRVNFFTEAFEQRPPDLGDFFYARLIQRLGRSDVVGPGPAWHGPCEAEVFRGKLWGFRGVGDPAVEGQIYFDSILGTAWSGGGIPYPGKSTFWRQLRRRGELLFWFGFDPGEVDNGSTDMPICAIADGKNVRRARLDYLVKRVTRCSDGAGGETLLIAGNDTATGQSLFNSGRALCVVELPSQGTVPPGLPRVCSFWIPEANEFRLTRSVFAETGGDIEKLPPFFRWQPKPGLNGGGYWVASQELPAEPYLKTDAGSALFIRFHLTGDPPYDLSVWGRLCFNIGPDGSLVGDNWDDGFEPSPTATNADEALDQMPDGTRWRVIQREVPHVAQPLAAIQVTDVGEAKELTAEREIYPTLWARYDSAANPADLTSYTCLLHYARTAAAPTEVKRAAEVVVLVSPDAQPCRLPAVGRRFL